MVSVVFIDMTLKMLIKFVQITNSYSLQTGLGLVLVGIPPSLGHSTYSIALIDTWPKFMRAISMGKILDAA